MQKPAMWSGWKVLFHGGVGVLILILLAASGLTGGRAFAQATSTNGGSIVGTISDPSGAILPGATVAIVNTDTGQTRTVTTDSAGFYSVGPLNPGPYSISVTAGGFAKLTVASVVRTGTVTNGSFRLTVGASTTVIEVTAGALQVNTDQAGVSDVINREQIDSLPVNGRNFLDVAQLQPGVVLQSGQTFDPTKAGYSAISVGGVSGRTTRILLDGQDITDETVGTTIMNVTTGAIDEFQLNRSTQDVSGEVTSTGQVLVATRSGTNALHGQFFYDFQDYRAGFAATTGGYNAPFQRNQFGGAIGGPIIKNKLFFFADSERIKQDEEASATTSPIFAAVQSKYPTIPSPFRDTYSTIRLDYNGPWGAHLFVRGAYNVNSANANYNDLYSLYQSRNNVPALVGGVDFATGRFTHSFRGGYEKFHNLLGDGTAGVTSIYNPTTLIGSPVTLVDPVDSFYAGANYLAPQGTFQSDKQFRYDGTWTRGAHTIKFGAELNRILGGGFAAFYGPSLYTVFSSGSLLTGPTPANPNAAGCSGVAGAAPCPGDPINGYSSSQYVLGNGNGFFTEKPGFGLSGGGTFSWRSAAYVADSWKVSSYVTLIAGLRWSIDTDRANQDLSTPLCSSVKSSYQFTGCTGATPLLSQFQAGLGYPTKQPFANFGPQAGFVFSPGSHKLAIRGGGGLFFESDIFNNTTNARSALVNANGNYFNYTSVCGGTNQVTLPTGTVLTSVNGVPLTTICNESIAKAAPQINALKAQYQAASQTGGPNPGYIGNGGGLESTGVYAGPYQTPYAIQFNGGIQEEIHKGMVITIDYVHNATIKAPLLIDVNHVGAARFLNVTAAKTAIAATLASCGAASINAAIAPNGCPSSTTGKNGGASIVDFASNGLDSVNQYSYGYPAQVAGTPVAAFPGANPNVGLGKIILPVGRSGYDALQMVFRQQAAHPAPGILNSNLQVSYSLSRAVNPIGITTSQTNPSDQFFNSSPWDYDNPNEYMGRSNLDRTNELSFGGAVKVKYGLNVAVIGHFDSALATSLVLDSTSGDAGEIFRTDVTGDGTSGDLVPGTLPGYYMHQVKGAGLNRLINNYNATMAGQPTPAGQALISAGLFTAAQLRALNGVQQQIATAPGTPVSNPALRTLDANVSYPIVLRRVREGLSVEPGVAMYNVTNMSNFGVLTGTLANVNTAGGAVGTTSGFLNGPNNISVRDLNRTQRGAGTFALGAPRTTEFNLKLNF